MSASIKLFNCAFPLIALTLVRFVISANNPCRSGTCAAISKCRNYLSNTLIYLPCGKTNHEIKICCVAGTVLHEKPKHKLTLSLDLNKSAAETEYGMRVINNTFCGKNILNLIANGVDASISELPWMVFLVYQDDKTPIINMKCSGTLITDQYVLTAAHCIRFSLFKVRLGEYDLRGDPDCIGEGLRKKCSLPIQEIEAEEGIRHRSFNPHKLIYDIGLVRLKKKAVFSETVQPVCLPIVDESEVLTSANLIIAGWGRQDVGIDAVILQKATVTLANNSHCQNLFNSVRIHNTQICTESINRSQACPGDSGGPLLYYSNNMGDAKYVQYGITSYGAATCNSAQPEVFTNVVSFLYWITGNIRP